MAAPVHRLRVGDALERLHLLRPGAADYLRSEQRGEAHRPIDIWRREVRIDPARGGDRLVLLQRRDGAAGAGDLQASVFELPALRPLEHRRERSRDGTVQVEAFRFSANGAFGDAAAEGDPRSGFAQAFEEPMFNFEADLELLQTLPWAPGYSVSIPFYHPGGGAPARYVWSVAGEDAVTAPDGRAIGCWLVETDYNVPGGPPARFWLARSTQQVLRMEAQAPDGVLHRKTLLTPWTDERSPSREAR